MVEYWRKGFGKLPGAQWFRETVLPLFTSTCMPMFAVELGEMCALFSEEGDATAAFVIGHWPATDASKMPLFMAALGVAARVSGADGRRKIGKQIFARIRDALRFQHGGVRGAALKLIEDTAFLELFEPEEVAGMYGALAEVAEDEGPMRARAVVALAAVAEKCVGLNADGMEENSIGENGWEESWRLVRSAADESVAR
jgi:hypothetical protein